MKLALSSDHRGLGLLKVIASELEDMRWSCSHCPRAKLRLSRSGGCLRSSEER